MPRMRSVVWEFYTKREKSIVFCRVCEKNIRYYGSTTNLLDHLKRRHNKALEREIQERRLEAIDDTDETELLEFCSAKKSDLEESVEMDPDLDPFASSSTPNQPKLSGKTDDSKSLLKKNVGSTSHNNEPNFLEPDTIRCTEDEKRTFVSSIFFPETPQRSLKPTIIDSLSLEPLTEIKINRINTNLVDWLTCSMEPFDIVEHKHFKTFINEIEPRYSVPSCKTLITTVLPERYNVIKNRVEQLLSKTYDVALSVDLWTSINNPALIAVTSHFISEGKLFSLLLTARNIPRNNTGEEIANILLSIMEDWGILAKTFIVVSDNSSTMTEAVLRLGLQHHTCVAHSLNLAIQNVLNHPSLQRINCIKQKCRSVVDFFKTDSTAIARLVEAQTELDRPALKLIQDELTRWDPTLVMFKRFLELREPLLITLPFLKPVSESLISEDWDIIADVIPLLNHFHELTELISGETYITASNVIPLIRGTQTLLKDASPKTQECIKFQSLLLNEFSNMTVIYENPNGPLAKATLLDPRLKKYAFEQADNASKAYESVLSELMDQIIGNDVEGMNEMTNVTELKNKGELKNAWSFFESKTKDVVKLQSTSSVVTEDFRLYVSMPLIDRVQGDAIAFWMKLGGSMKEVPALALKYLSIPATTQTSERFFSTKLGNICNDLQSETTPSNFEMITFLNSNIKYF